MTTIDVAAYERLREDAKALGFLLVPESETALLFMKRRSYEEWRTENPESALDFDGWIIMQMDDL